MPRTPAAQDAHGNLMPWGSSQCGGQGRDQQPNPVGTGSTDTWGHSTPISGKATSQASFQSSDGSGTRKSLEVSSSISTGAHSVGVTGLHRLKSRPGRRDGHLSRRAIPGPHMVVNVMMEVTNVPWKPEDWLCTQKATELAVSLQKQCGGREVGIWPSGQDTNPNPHLRYLVPTFECLGSIPS